MNNLGVFHNINLKKSTDLMSAFDRVLFQTSDLVDKMDNYEMDPNNIIKKKKIQNKIKEKNYNPYTAQSKAYEENLVEEIDRMFNPNQQNEIEELTGMMNLLRNRDIESKKKNNEDKVKYSYGNNKYNNFNSKPYSLRNNQYGYNRKNHIGNYKSNRLNGINNGNHLIHASKFVLNNNNKKRSYKKNSFY